MDLTHGSFFSGIEGFGLGARWAGIETIWNYEIDKFCNAINKKNFPNAVQYKDVRSRKNPIPANVISMGSPCQDISISGKGTGIFGEQSSLFFEGIELIRDIKERGGAQYILFENSPEILKKGFEHILLQFSEIGYNVEWKVLSGTQFGIQQKRKRLYLIAYTNSFEFQGAATESIFSKSFLQGEFQRVYPGWKTRWDIPKPRNFRSVNDFPNLLDRNRAIGNAVMPLVAKYLFECIKTHYLSICCNGTATVN